MNKNQFGYTDYPLEGGGIHRIKILSYDRNKYAKISYMVGGEEHFDEIKRGYIFKDTGLTKRFPNIFWCNLREDEDSKIPSRLEAHQELKRDRKEVCKISYRVYDGDVLSMDGISEVSTLDAALRKVAKLKNMLLDRRNGRFNSSSILEKENGVYVRFIERHTSKTILKTRHMKRLRNYAK